MIKSKFDQTKASNTKEDWSKNQKEKILDPFTLTNHKQLTLEMTNKQMTNEQIFKASSSKSKETSWRESERIRNWLVLVFSTYESWCEFEIDHCVIV